MNAASSTWISSESQKHGAPDFDRLARVYRWMEMFTFGSRLERCRRAFLRDMHGSRHAAVLGDGDGRFTAQLLRSNAKVDIEAVDASREMLRQLLRRTESNAPRVCVQHADAREWLPAKPPYDLVVTHFFLDCFTREEVQVLAGRLRESLSPEALWVLSEFSVPEGCFGRWVARPVIWFLYRAFALLTGLKVRRLPDHRAALRAAGFACRERKTFLNGLLTAEIWTAVR